MDNKQALQILVDIATRWGENTEEGFSRRVQLTDTDEQCRELADEDLYDLDDVIEVRDLWKAVDMVKEQLK